MFFDKFFIPKFGFYSKFDLIFYFDRGSLLNLLVYFKVIFDSGLVTTSKYDTKLKMYNP